MPTRALATSRSSRSPAPMRTTRPAGQRRVAGGVRRGTATLDGAGPLTGRTAQWRRQAGRCLRRQGRCACRARSLRRADGQLSSSRPAARPGIIPAVPARSSSARRSCSAISASSTRRCWKRSTFPARSAGFEVYVDAMPEPKKKATRTKPALELSPFQAVKRDFAFVVDKAVEAGAILKAASAPTASWSPASTSSTSSKALRSAKTRSRWRSRS